MYSSAHLSRRRGSDQFAFGIHKNRITVHRNIPRYCVGCWLHTIQRCNFLLLHCSSSTCQHQESYSISCFTLSFHSNKLKLVLWILIGAWATHVPDKIAFVIGRPCILPWYSGLTLSGMKLLPLWTVNILLIYSKQYASLVQNKTKVLYLLSSHEPWLLQLFQQSG